VLGQTYAPQEVLVVDDGSTDGTAAAALAAGADHVVRNHTNRGLAATFRIAMREALARGVGVIVNTDADNHYDQTRIPDLIQPVLRGEADIVVGSRDIDRLGMRPPNRYGNKIGNAVMQRILDIPGLDVSSGFRAYSREAALRLNVLSGHTYTHETLIAAATQGLKVVSITIPARDVERPSRLIRSIRSHFWRAGTTIAKSLAMYRPMQVFGGAGAILMMAGLAPFARFLWLYLRDGNAGGHVQSLIAGTVLTFLGVQSLVVAFVATALSWNRRLIEETLYVIRREQADEAAELAYVRESMRSVAVEREKAQVA
jgi:glycosyltransferase involved in cell wall biosynthesis